MLVIVDMQPSFDAANCVKTITEVILEIEYARKTNEPIIVLEFEDYGETHEDIMKALEGYDNYKIVTKPDNDGSTEVIEAVNKFGLHHDNLTFHVCGVNFHACVSDTVCGLAYDFGVEKENLNVIETACNDYVEDYDGHHYGWECVRERLEEIATFEYDSNRD